MHKVVRKSDAFVRNITDNKTATNYITKDFSPGVSLATTKASDFQEDQMAKYNRVYFVIEGELTLDFEDESVTLKANDSCFVSKGTEYSMSGTFNAVVVNQPAFGS